MNDQILFSQILQYSVCFVIKSEVCGVYFRWSVSHALYRLACKLLALSVLVSPLREQSPSNRVRYGTPSGVITGPSLSRVLPLQRAILHCN
jgi:hypothetical protein